MKIINSQNSQIYIGESYLKMDKYVSDCQLIIITDENVYGYYKTFIDNYEHIIIPAGEKAKSWNTVNYIVERLLVLNADRNSFLIGMGGGVVTDITGFVASIFMRGIKFGFLASSLLAQVDASLGGKNGINFSQYKNMLGVFNAPEFVICDPELLRTLAAKEIRSGFGEVLKHAFIKDRVFYEYLNENAEDLLELEMDKLEYVIHHSVSLKAEIVAADWLEKGERKKLNFGHTLGHAIENNSELTHGESVAVGMCCAGKIAVDKGILAQEEFLKMQALILKYKLPVSHEIPSIILKEFIQKDKKKKGTSIDFVFLEKIGKAKVSLMSLEELFGLLN